MGASSSRQRAQNPIQGRDASGDWPPGGRFFPLGSGSKAKGNWPGFFAYLTALKAGMAAGFIEPKGQKLTASQAVKGMKANFFTTVLATVQCGGWSIAWATAVAGVIAQCYPTCSHLDLVAVAGGPACEEELAFVHIILAELGFKTFGAPDVGKVDTTWMWSTERPGATLFWVVLQKFHSLDVVDSIAQRFGAKESRSAAPDFHRVAVVSCAEKWPPQERETLYLPEKGADGTNLVAEGEAGSFRVCRPGGGGLLFYKSKDYADEEPKGRMVRSNQIVKGTLDKGWLKVELQEKEAARLNGEGKTVNDVLNERINAALDKTTSIAEQKGYAPEAHWDKSEEACMAYQKYFDLPVVSLQQMGIAPTGC